MASIQSHRSSHQTDLESSYREKGGPTLGGTEERIRDGSVTEVKRKKVHNGTGEEKI